MPKWRVNISSSTEARTASGANSPVAAWHLSAVLLASLLSRLTGDPRYQDLRGGIRGREDGRRGEGRGGLDTNVHVKRRYQGRSFIEQLKPLISRKFPDRGLPRVYKSQG